MTKHIIPDHLPRFHGGTGDGKDKVCVMQYISLIQGERGTKIREGAYVPTDFPECSNAALSRMVQSVNDEISSYRGNGSWTYLSPEESLEMLQLGLLTVGTGAATMEEERLWMEKIRFRPFYPTSRPICRTGSSAGVMLADRIFTWAAHQFPDDRAQQIRAIVEEVRNLIQMFRDVMGLDQPATLEQISPPAAGDGRLAPLALITGRVDE